MTLLRLVNISRIIYANGAHQAWVGNISRADYPYSPSIFKRINEFSPNASKPFVLGLPTGSSPIPTYKALIKLVNAKKLSWVFLFLPLSAPCTCVTMFPVFDMSTLLRTAIVPQYIYCCPFFCSLSLEKTSPQFVCIRSNSNPPLDSNMLLHSTWMNTLDFLATIPNLIIRSCSVNSSLTVCANLNIWLLAWSRRVLNLCVSWADYHSPIVDIPPSQVNILDGNAEDLVGECNAYEARIRSYGGIELFLGGIGEDGHIAFNEPGQSDSLCWPILDYTSVFRSFSRRCYRLVYPYVIKVLLSPHVPASRRLLMIPSSRMHAFSITTYPPSRGWPWRLVWQQY